MRYSQSDTYKFLTRRIVIYITPPEFSNSATVFLEKIYLACSRKKKDKKLHVMITTEKFHIRIYTIRPGPYNDSCNEAKCKLFEMFILFLQITTDNLVMFL